MNVRLFLNLVYLFIIFGCSPLRQIKQQIIQEDEYHVYNYLLEYYNSDKNLLAVLISDSSINAITSMTPEGRKIIPDSISLRLIKQHYIYNTYRVKFDKKFFTKNINIVLRSEAEAKLHIDYSSPDKVKVYWEQLSLLYPKILGIVSFSRVAFNFNKTYAMVQFEIVRGNLDASFLSVFLRKENGNWKVIYSRNTGAS